MWLERLRNHGDESAFTICVEETGRCQNGHVDFGTPGYALYDPAVDDPLAGVRSNLYALSGTLYDRLTGEAPFPAKSSVYPGIAYLRMCFAVPVSLLARRSESNNHAAVQGPHGTAPR
jgi:hypothetical protein